MQKNSLENLDDENIPLTKSKKSEKPNLKKIRSEKQIEAFNRTMEIRKQKVEQRKQEKLLESAKLLLEKTTLKKEIPSKKITPIEKYTDSYEDDSAVETSSDDDSLELSNIIVFLDGFFLCFSFNDFGFDLGLFLTIIISSSVSSPDDVSTVESSS